jgi:Domain of unknown function (DUF6852)/Domain of unknown function (DUF5606)
MDLSKILSISGRSGLFKVISQGKNAVIVESLTDKKRFPAFGHERMSSLEEISIFTTGEDRPLKDVLKAFHDKLEGKPGPESKTADAELMKMFGEIVPDYDPDRVYISDIRKMFAWYNLLLTNDILDFTEEKEEGKDKEEEQTEQK